MNKFSMNVSREDAMQVSTQKAKAGLLQTEKSGSKRVIVGNIFSMADVNYSQLIKNSTDTENLAF